MTLWSPRSSSVVSSLRVVGDLSVGGSVRSRSNGAERFTVHGSSTTTGAASTTIAAFTPTPGRSYLVVAYIVGRRTNGADPGQTNTYVVEQQIKVSSAGVVTVGATLGVRSAVDVGSWAAAIDTASGTIRARGAGVASQDIRWTATMVVDET